MYFYDLISPHIVLITNILLFWCRLLKITLRNIGTKKIDILNKGNEITIENYLMDLNNLLF